MAIAVALLGCAHPHVPDVLGVVASEPDVHLAAVWSADRSAVPGAVADYVVQSPDTAISRADVAIVCAPTDERPALCVRAAQAGRPILVEEPLARTAAEAARVAREIARSRTPAYATLFLRELPGLGRLRAVLGSDVLGRVTSAAATYLSPVALDGAAATAAMGWMRQARRAGGGAMTHLGIHLVDALTALGARPRLDAVRLDRRGADRSDLGGVAVGRWGDVPLTVRTSWIVRPGGLEVVINGTVATAALRDGTLEIAADLGAPERWVGAPPDVGEAVRAFLARLRARHLEEDGLRAAVTAHEVIDRAPVL
ncbi:MAG: Gfo/Idh/MocA family protein [Solirubrobacteraceae bacterium]